MSQTQPIAIVAYLYKGDWYRPEEVETKRNADPDAFKNALPYTIIALQNWWKYGGDVPEWIDLDEPGQG